MPLIASGGLRHSYRLEGNDDKPVLMFAHSLGCDHSQWDAQSLALPPYFRTLRYDIRGHGATGVPAGDYSIEELGRDAFAIADALGIQQFAFCGLSLGGMIGQWLAANGPGRMTSLILANTSAHYPDPSMIETRRRTVLGRGMAAVVDGILDRFFTAATLAQNSPAVADIRRVVLATHPGGYAGCCAAIRDMDLRPILGEIRVPVLILVGDHDLSTPFDGHGEVLKGEIAGARLERLPTAHLSNVERPTEFTAALTRFLLRSPDDASST